MPLLYAHLPGLYHILLSNNSKPAVRIGSGMVRIYFNGLGKVRDGLRQVALLS